MAAWMCSAVTFFHQMGVHMDSESLVGALLRAIPTRLTKPSSGDPARGIGSPFVGNPAYDEFQASPVDAERKYQRVTVVVVGIPPNASEEAIKAALEKGAVFPSSFCSLLNPMITSRVTSRDRLWRPLGASSPNYSMATLLLCRSTAWHWLWGFLGVGTTGVLPAHW